MPDHEERRFSPGELHDVLTVLQVHGLLGRARIIKVGDIQIEADADIRAQLRDLAPSDDEPKTVGGALKGERLIGSNKPVEPVAQSPYEYDHSE